MTINELIERNNELRAGLSEKNQKFYDDFLLYARTTSWLKDEQAVEELLLKSLQDILKAQKNGQSAADYLGKNPQAAAAVLLKKLPIHWESFAKLLFYVFFGYLAIAFIPAISVPGKVVDLGAYMMAGLYLTVAACIVAWTIDAAVYRFQKIRVANWAKLVLSTIAGIILVFPAFAISFWLKTALRLSFDGWVGIATIVLILIVLAIYQKNARTSEVINRPIYYYILFQAVIGIGSRLPFMEGMMATKLGKLGLAILLGFGLLIFWLVSWRVIKKLNDHD
ncbi:hypothetical protein [Fructobacillus parabroussonetiae]|uniref:Integral membrane protein n=1 Tax=Fructobacillus parabroussonetiae TaxID=2713174 RepID=A0ABS5QYB2_9LACO|nr:hypothetical protein [Fructobacillus parabroussonetiae]MBS9337274.1 hypothetical protein [Fructobacillus parabroussonetiae]